MIHYFGDSHGGGEIAAVELQFHLIGRRRRRSQTLDRRSGWYAPDGRMIDRLSGAHSAGNESSGDHWSLRNGVDLAINATQAGHYEKAALKAGSVADRGYRRVNAGSGLRERR